MVQSTQICSLFLIIYISCISSELVCNFHEFLDITSIYTCELVQKSINIKEGHMANKTNTDVQSIKFDGFKTSETFDIKLPFCKNYKNLEIVKLFSAGITDLHPNLLNECTNLKSLSLASNKIREVPENLFFRNSKLTILSFEQNNLTTLPGNVFASLNDLIDLNLSKNKIESLPQTIFASLVNLRVLKLSSNKIQSINPNWFRNLRKLEDLDLSGNLVTNLGEKVFQFLTNLQSLQLNQNQIEELKPNVFHNLVRLQELNLDFNRISSPPAEAFESLTKLKKLSFGANGIEELPKEIFSNLKRLEELKLWQNKLSTIHSDSFGSYKGLLLIDLEENQIEAVDPELIINVGGLRLYMDGNQCYQGDLEDKNEMLQELNECFENYEPRENGTVETTTFDYNTATYPLYTKTYFTSTSKTMLPDTTTRRIETTTHFLCRPASTDPRCPPNCKVNPNDPRCPRIPTQRPQTRRTRTTTGRMTTIVEEMELTSSVPLPYPTRPSSVPAPRPTSTTPTSLWNLLEPENIPTCGRSKLKLGVEVSGSHVRHGAYPWTAALIRKDGQLFCGGILVSRNLVVTAAHCIEGKKRSYVFNNQDFFIMLGAHNVKQSYEKGRTTVSVKMIHIHQDWNPYIDQYDADIAIIELEAEVKLSRFIQPICIPEAGSIPATKDQGFVVGFGKSEFADVQDIARMVQTPIHDNRECHSSHEAYQLLLSHRGFCGGYANGTGVCTGDSGSGLIVVHDGVYYLRGIVSASLTGPLNGCNLKTYSIFTDIMEFTGWIKIGKDDKTLIQYLIDRIRKCEDKKSPTVRQRTTTPFSRTTRESWRVQFPND